MSQSAVGKSVGKKELSDPAGPECFLLADLIIASQGLAPSQPHQDTLNMSAKNWIYWPDPYWLCGQQTFQEENSFTE